MKNLIVFVILSLFSLQSAIGQDSINVSKYKPESFSIDINGSIFLISGNSLYKLDGNDSNTIEFSNKMYGSITSVDVSNPFKILVFYKETGMIVFLDNHLKELQSPISLPKQGLLNTELACTGSDNSFWIYYTDTRQIIKFNYQINVITSTPDLSVLCPTSTTPTIITERGDKLFMLIPEFGVVIFYTSGNYCQTINFKKISSFMPLSENELFYISDNAIPFIMNFRTNSFNELTSLTKYNSNNQIVYFNNKIYELDKDRIKIHTLKVHESSNQK